MTRTRLKIEIKCPTCGKTPGREYLRVSVDKSGRERSPEEQHEDHTRSSERHGFCLCAPEYRDIGSASPHAQKERDGFNRLVDDLEEDRFGAVLLVLWDSSRGSRKSWEWGRLVELCADRGVQFFINQHGRILDPTNARDRRTMQEDATDAEFASAKISEGVTRAAERDAARGRWHGRPSYGYKRLRDPDTGKTIDQVKVPHEAKVIAELFRRLERGHSFRGIAADFKTRGIAKRSGGPFSPAHLRALATNIAYAGTRVHDIGRRGRVISDEAVFVKGQWKAIVPMRRWLKVQRIITAPERRTSRPGRAVHWLSMIGLCDACGGPIAARASKKRVPEYTCHVKGCFRIGETEVDEYVEELVLAYLTSEGVADALATDDGNDEALEQVRAEVEAITQEHQDLAAQLALGPDNGGISAPLAAAAEPGILKRLRDAQARERELATPNVLAQFLLPGETVERSWREAPMSTRRAVARRVLSPDLLGEVRILRSPTPGHRCPVDLRIVVGQPKSVS